MQRILKNTHFSYVGITLMLASYFAFLVNIPIYATLHSILSSLDSVKIGFVISIPLFFLAAFNLLFNLFSWPWITKPFFAVLLLVSAAASYAGFNYGTLFDSDMIANILETDSAEASAYLSAYSVLWIGLMGVLPAVLLAVTPIRSSGSWLRFIGRKLVSMVISLAVIVAIAGLYYQDYASVGRNNPYLRQEIIPTQLVYSIGKYVHRTYFYQPMAYQVLGEDAQQSSQALQQATTKPTLMVFILGETARSNNFELNGYPRATNAYTKDLDVISFSQVSSCGTATAVSVPCMFSAMKHDNYSKRVADNQDNVIDILKRANVDQLWLENDGGDKGVAHNIQKTVVDRNAKNAFCDGNTCYDMAMLEDFSQRVDGMQGNRVVFLHGMGSHGPTYFRRYPEQQAAFQPDCPRADIENCSVEQIVNSYDNTILYTDYVIAQTIEQLKALQNQFNTALIYVSDHGESLGEDGLFLHGMPYALAPENQTKVPMLFWASNGFAKEKGLDRKCLANEATHGAFSHDNLFHSMLGIMDVKTQVYQSDLDIFAQCRS
ncbi:TPA: phosphoethanolamine--lipid A transferase [Vibrio vulnificus]|uniref:Membrane-associated metal-dependent hydrolase n=3 Tax=Vibrio vulnificus TaxID=672 RepID=A0AAN1PU51_VIBVL|nr:phosphoethanolamine--lipid A transferase [Vibrio vulnificus]ANN29363.1 putative membrane-associated metal-dependent hydrolase [Vibrio vulnificus]ASC59853.1 putative membrane-associated metal-dependent hydrolase [Vibrio vulnificus]AXX62629.1 putative membrane-associated metal-dependent hydrolase [Vibrio vulnificus]QBH29762.1 putative membrane-associated metal-dependent hydrolase [Vibrio vulnificus]QBN15885.1 phosphoethanolamine--lipid A transferase [Vibrio vulnificus]